MQLDLPLVVGALLLVIYVQMRCTGVRGVRRNKQNRRKVGRTAPSPPRKPAGLCVPQTTVELEAAPARSRFHNLRRGHREPAEEFGPRTYAEAWHRSCWDASAIIKWIGYGRMVSGTRVSTSGPIQSVDLYHALQTCGSSQPDLYPNDSPPHRLVYDAANKLDTRPGSKALWPRCALLPPLIQSGGETIRTQKPTYFHEKAARMRYPAFDEKRLSVREVIEPRLQTLAGLCSNVPACSVRPPVPTPSSAPALLPPLSGGEDYWKPAELKSLYMSAPVAHGLLMQAMTRSPRSISREPVLFDLVQKACTSDSKTDWSESTVSILKAH